MAPKPLTQSIKDEARYALADIRAAWEKAWFGEPVTPAQWQSHITEQGGPAPEAPEREALYGRDPQGWDAKCRAFFEPAAEPASQSDIAPGRAPDEPERLGIER